MNGDNMMNAVRCKQVEFSGMTEMGYLKDKFNEFLQTKI
jgi:hypothetical protein